MLAGFEIQARVLEEAKGASEEESWQTVEQSADAVDSSESDCFASPAPILCFRAGVAYVLREFPVRGDTRYQLRFRWTNEHGQGYWQQTDLFRTPVLILRSLAIDSFTNMCCCDNDRSMRRPIARTSTLPFRASTGPK